MIRQIFGLLIVSLLIACEDNNVITDAHFVGTWDATFSFKQYNNGEYINGYDEDGYVFRLDEGGDGIFTQYGEDLSCSWAYVASKEEIHIGLRDTIYPITLISYQVKEISEIAQFWESEQVFSPEATYIYSYQLTKRQ